MTTENSGSDLNFSITTTSPAETRQLGTGMGKQLGGGMVVALFGDLGSGKTVFIQGLARGLDVPENYYITSPTYTLINEYPGRHTLYHVDLYRLAGPADFESIGLYDILHHKGVAAIEWADRLTDELLAEHVRVQLEITGDNKRKICFNGYGLKPLNLLIGLEKSITK